MTHKSDCGKYNVNDLLEMFDETEITIDEYGNTDGVTVNDCIESFMNISLVTKDLVVTSECDDMFCYLEIDVPCSLELDYEFQYQSE